MIENGILKPNGGLQHRGGTAANLTAVNPLLKNREIVVETDTGKAKIGDGRHRWTELAYMQGGSGSGGSGTIGDLEDLTTTNKSSIVAAINEVNASHVRLREPMLELSQTVVQSYKDESTVITATWRSDGVLSATSDNENVSVVVDNDTITITSSVILNAPVTVTVELSPTVFYFGDVVLITVQEGVPRDPELMLSKESVVVTKTVSEVVTATLISEGVISATSDSPSVVVTVNNKEITVIGAGVASGTAIITVVVSAVYGYASASATFEVTVNPGVRYGYRISKTESDPYECVEYLYDAVGKTPAYMDFTNGVFDYGDWGNAWFIADNKPCMLKSDKTVDYYLNPNDYSLKEDGTASDVANTSYDGNAMAQFPLVWIYRYEDDDYYYEIVSNIQWDENYKAYAHTREDGSIADYFYWSIYLACSNTDDRYNTLKSFSGQDVYFYVPYQTFTLSNDGNLRNSFYNSTQRSWSQRELIRTLLILISKSTNNWEKFGVGKIDNATPLTTGILDNKGQFFGYSDNSHQVKVFHVEAVWGCLPYFVRGFLFRITNQPLTMLYCKMTPPYRELDFTANIIFSNKYSNNANLVDNSGYLKTVYCSEYGMLPVNSSGSATTFFCSYCNIIYPDCERSIGVSTSGQANVKYSCFSLASFPRKTVTSSIASALSFFSPVEVES